MKKYDALIIGSGQGGTPLAKKLANAGYQTAIVERRWVGGTCVNDGCTPTKTMIASARVAHTVKNSDAMGVNVGHHAIDITRVITRQQDIVTSFRNGSEKKLNSTDNLDLIHGEASFTGHKTLLVKKNDGGSEILMSDLIVLDTGTVPSVPDIEGLETIPYLTSTSILQLEELPQHLVVIGGGYVGMEFAQMYKRFGSRVTMIIRDARILKREDDDIASEIHKLFEDEDIDIRLNSETLKIRPANGSVNVIIRSNDKEKTISCSHVLMATGRKPDTGILNLSATGVRTDERGFITVDNKLQTNVKGILAVGDVNGGPAFTHISYHDHLVIFKNLVHQKDETTDGRMLPYCMYIDPQLGRVGVTEQEARSKGIEIQIARLPMAHVARAIQTGDTRGLMKAVVDKGSKKILGAAILGAEGGEIMSVIEMAMMGGLTYDQIRDAVFAHPSYAESLNNLFASMD